MLRTKWFLISLTKNTNSLVMLRPKWLHLCSGQPSDARCLSTLLRPLNAISVVHWRIREKLYGEIFLNTSTASIKAAGTNADGNQGVGEYERNEDIKAALYQAVRGINRGIFGVTSAKKSEIWELVELLESRNPTPNPTDGLLDKDLETKRVIGSGYEYGGIYYLDGHIPKACSTVNGSWKLVYSTIFILGAKRTKLGLRDFITLGDFIQKIDATKKKAFNVIKFNASGFKMLNGQLTIEASYKISSKTRVDIKLENSSITPTQLMNLFKKNYDLLLAVFNPEGWLEMTYVDDSFRIGRDDKGNIFVLERTGEEL